MVAAVPRNVVIIQFHNSESSDDMASAPAVLISCAGELETQETTGGEEMETSKLLLEGS